MNGLLSLLAGLGDARQPDVDMPTGDTEVSAIEVNPVKKPVPASRSLAVSAPANLDNSSDIAAVNKQAAASPSIQRPKSTLRDVLGLLGDSFLIQEGNKPVYAPSIDARRQAEAMAGFTNNPAGAAERLAGLGLDGTPELANTIFNNANNVEIKKQGAENTNLYHQQLNDNRIASRVEKLMPTLGPLLQRPQNKDDYALAWQRAAQIAKRQGLTPEDLGMIDPDDWEPGILNGYGMKSNEVAVDADRDAKRDLDGKLGQGRIDASMRNTDARNATSAANNRRSTGASMRNADIRSGDSRYSTDNRGKGSKGTKEPLKPASPTAIAYLRKNPKLAKDFDAKYGKGAAKAYAGLK